MREGAIAVVGDKYSVLAFKAIGVDVFPVEGEIQARETVHTLARSYSVIFVTEKVAVAADMYIKRYKSRAYPVIVPIPSAEGSMNLGLKGIDANVEKAIGANVFIDSKED